MTYTAAQGNAGFLTHRVRPGIERASSQRQHWVLNPLSRNENAELWLFKNQHKKNLVRHHLRPKKKICRSCAWIRTGTNSKERKSKTEAQHERQRKCSQRSESRGGRGRSTHGLGPNGTGPRVTQRLHETVRLYGKDSQARLCPSKRNDNQNLPGLPFLIYQRQEARTGTPLSPRGWGHHHLGSSKATAGAPAQGQGRPCETCLRSSGTGHPGRQEARAHKSLPGGDSTGNETGPSPGAGAGAGAGAGEAADAHAAWPAGREAPRSRGRTAWVFVQAFRTGQGRETWACTLQPCKDTQEEPAVLGLGTGQTGKGWEKDLLFTATHTAYYQV